jgi:hypothetical protein
MKIEVRTEVRPALQAQHECRVRRRMKAADLSANFSDEVLAAGGNRELALRIRRALTIQ